LVKEYKVLDGQGNSDRCLKSITPQGDCSKKNNDVLFVGNVVPKSDHVERSNLAKRFFIAGWERKRAKSQEGEAGRARA
jgi:hypothetical protein